MHRRAHLLGRVVQAVDVGGLQDLHAAALCLRALGDQRGDLVQALDVLAARFDVHQIAQRVQQRLLLFLRQGVHIGHWCGLRQGAGESQGQECNQWTHEQGKGLRGRHGGSSGNEWWKSHYGPLQRKIHTL